jgi:hypothetical protein
VVELIVCVRTVRIPTDARERFLGWIAENRELRERYGLLFELVLERSARQNPAKTLQASPQTRSVEDALVITAWPSHEVFDAWIDTPDRDRLTDSAVHASVEFGPITRYDMAGGYLNIVGLTAVADEEREAGP